jgi:hypothetical protein
VTILESKKAKNGHTASFVLFFLQTNASPKPYCPRQPDAPPILLRYC